MEAVVPQYSSREQAESSFFGGPQGDYGTGIDTRSLGYSIPVTSGKGKIRSIRNLEDPFLYMGLLE